MPLTAGSRLGRYEIRSLLGAGGMGEVYLAYDPDLEREVAVKVLHDGHDSGNRARRFIQEAKAASALHHPNVAHVYEIGSHEGFRFIAMEVIDGETLRERIGRGPMPVAMAMDIATQIASALSAAHKQGIIHRDIKPENVIITNDGYAKVLDFGLAKLRDRPDDAATVVRTATGVAMGTLQYMPPEQLEGHEVTAAADVFSLGIVIHEMVAGRRPGAKDVSLRNAPPKLKAIIEKCLDKDPEDRYPTASELLDELRAIPAEPKRDSKVIFAVAAVAVIVAIIAIAVVGFQRTRRQRIAQEQLNTAEKLVGERKIAEAYDVVAAAAAVLPDSDRVRDLLTRTSDRLTIESDPPGATVFAQRFKGSPERVRLGVTPLKIPRIARADYLLTFEKPGYATATGTVALTPAYLLGEAYFRDPIPVRARLVETTKMPAGMVTVTGGEYRLAGYMRPSERPVVLQDFFIDRYEVSNREFEQFVRDGGYRRRELWKPAFVDQGKPVTFEQAMSRFRDATGLPGPRGWNGGAPPQGRENHPVVDVTWYEAAAFAEWKGKKLPSIYQWEKAARYPAVSQALPSYPWGELGEGTDATERSNFLGAGTMAVDTMPFGASPFGAHHMAGNVSEWCRNVDPPGYAARGGSFKDGVYAFGQTAALPGFYSAPTLGFRCVSGSGGDEGDFALNPSGHVPVYQPVDDRTFEEFRKRYEYARTPLNAKVVEKIDAPDWTREKIEFTVAGKSVPAYLYLPKGFRPPLQVIQFAPAGDVTAGHRTLTHSIEMHMAPYIRAGRALFSVELEGFLGRPRPRNWQQPDRAQDEYVDYIVERVTEMRRGLDYLETRPEIDRTRIALVGISAGGGTGVFISALESRYRSIVFAGTGISMGQVRNAPAANRINFASRINGAKLMLQGRYDEDTSLKSEAEPMFRLMREPKHLEIYEGSHVAPPEIQIPVITKWLDQTIGPVKQ